MHCIADLEDSPDRDYSNYRMDSLYRTTLRFAETFELDESVISLISEARDMVFECHINNELLNTLVRPQLFTGYPGRPKFEIPEEILRFLLDKRFTITETATLLRVISQRTVERRMNEFGIRIGNCYSNINDRDLDTVISNIICDFANVGYKRMSGRAETKALIGGVYIHIFTFCPTNFF